MKKLLLSTLTVATLFGADTPYRVSSATQYLNTLVDATSQRYYRAERNKTSFEANVDMSVSNSYNIVNIPVSYIHNDTWGVSAYIPVVNYHSDFGGQDVSETGLGDVTLAVHVNAGQLADNIPSKNIFELRYTFDNGDEDKGLGMGAQSIAILWDTTGKYNEWTFFASLMWSYYITKTKYDHEIGGDDYFWFGASHPCLLNDKIETSLKLEWQSKFKDANILGIEDPTSDYDIIAATVAWDSDKLIKNVPLKAGFRVPIYTSDNYEKSFIGFVSIGGLF